MYPNSIYFGHKVLPMEVHWAQTICYLGTWTVRDMKIAKLYVRAPSLASFKRQRHSSSLGTPKVYKASFKGIYKGSSKGSTMRGLWV